MPTVAIDRLGFIADHLLAVKGPCRAATTANITLEGIQDIDGVALATNDRVLVRSQSNAIENGLYYAKSGEWERTADFDQRGQVDRGTQLFVTDGTTYAQTLWLVTTSGRPVPGREAIGFEQFTLIQEDLSGHLADTSDAHDASAISYAGGTGMSATDVEAAVDELASEKQDAATAIAQGLHSLWVPAVAMVSRTTNGAASGTVEMATNKNMFRTLDFDTTTQEFAQFHIRMPKSWDEGTVTFAPVWSHPAAVTNFGVVFGLAGVAISNDDAGDVAFGTAQTSTDTGGTTNDIYEGPTSSAITIAGTPQVGDYVMFQINRTVSDGSDTLAVAARVHGITLFYSVNAANDA